LDQSHGLGEGTLSSPVQQAQGYRVFTPGDPKGTQRSNRRFISEHPRRFAIVKSYTSHDGKVITTERDTLLCQKWGASTCLIELRTRPRVVDILIWATGRTDEMNPQQLRQRGERIKTMRRSISRDTFSKRGLAPYEFPDSEFQFEARASRNSPQRPRADD